MSGMIKGIVKQSLLTLSILVITVVAHWMLDAEYQKLGEFLKERKHDHQDLVAQKNHFIWARDFIKNYEKVLIKARGTGMDQPANRIAVTEILENVGNECHIQNLKFKIHPHKALHIKEVTDKKIYSIMPIDLKIKGIFDGDVYQFIRRVDKELPGYVIPLHFSLKRQNEKRLQRFYGDLSLVEGEYQFALVVRDEEDGA